MPAHSRGYRRIFHTWPQRGPAPKASKHQRRQATPRHPGRAINREGWASDYRQMGATPLPACGHRSPLGRYVSLRPRMVIAAETPTSLLQSWIQTREPRVMPGPGQASVWAAIRDLVVDACPAVSPFCPLEGTSAFAQASAFPSPVSPAGMKGAGGRGTCPSHAPGAEGRRLSQGQAAPAPRWARPFLTVAKSSCHAGDTLLQAPGAISPDRAKASTIHSPAMQHFLIPWQGHRRRLETSPSAVPTTRCARPAPGRPPSHRVAASLLTAVPEKPRCLCQTHTAHARATGVTIPTPAPGAPRSPQLPWARVAAAPPPADPSGRPPRAPGTAPPATPLAPRPRPGPPLPPALRRARPAAAATSILGSPRPRFTNAASAGRRRRRGGRLRPPGDTASFT